MTNEERKYRLPKIKYYSDDKGKTIAVTSYAGKTLRATAKCAEGDTYDAELGKTIATDKLMEKFYTAKIYRLADIVNYYDEIIYELRRKQDKIFEAYNDTLDAYENYFDEEFFDEDFFDDVEVSDT